jgi:hypothetical protein
MENVFDSIDLTKTEPEPIHHTSPKSTKSAEEPLTKIPLTIPKPIPVQSTIKYIEAEDAFEKIDFVKHFRPDRKVSYGYLAIIAALRWQDPGRYQEQNLIALYPLIEKLCHPTESREMALVRLYDLLDDFIQLDAHEEMLDLWHKLNPIITNYFGPLFLFPITGNPIHKNEEIKKILQLGSTIQSDFMFGIIYELWRYQFAILRHNSKPLQTSFPEFSEDLIELQSVIVGEKFQPFIAKWKMIKKGIINRVWFSDTTDVRDDIEKLRSILRFFPVPYQTGANKMLFLLIPQEGCKDWMVKTILNRSDKSVTPIIDKRCGVNCLGSTILSLMVANDLGLLGTKVHVVKKPTHIYLATGNRETQWTDRSVGLIETTTRHKIRPRDVCEKPLMSLIEAKNASYHMTDYLIPNIYEYYVWVVMRVEKSYQYRITQGELTVPFLNKLLLYRSTNIFGVNEVILKDLHFYGHYDTLKEDVRVYDKLLELLRNMSEDMSSIVIIKDHFALEFNFVVDLLISHQQRTKMDKSIIEDTKQKCKSILDRIYIETGKESHTTLMTLKIGSLIA